MPDIRTNKSVAQRFDIEFNKRPEPALRRWRRVLAWICLLVPLLFVVLYELLGSGRAYWAGPLSNPHQSAFVVGARTGGEDGCKLCHTKVAQPLWRLVGGSKRATSVEDASCLHCHVYPHEKENNIKPLDHSSRMVESDVLNCAACHDEHRGGNKETLKAVASVRCVVCHGNLRTADGTPTCFAQVPRFEKHPEFAASRFRGLKVPAGDESPDKAHWVFKRVALKEGKLVDETQLKFNHARHLQEDGLVIRDAYPTSGPNDKSITTDARGVRRKELECGDCHVVNPDGKYVAPVNFNDHCRNCHPIHKTEGNPRGLDHPKPFAEFLTLAAQQPASKKPGADSPTEPPRLPTKPSKASAEELPAQQRAKLREELKDECDRCHIVRPAAADGKESYDVLPPYADHDIKKPRRWFPHSKFSHREHETHALCVYCHHPLADSESDDSPPQGSWQGRTTEEQLLPSKETSDILMPSVAVCQRCHGSSPSNQGPRQRSDCVYCHDYHPK